MIRYRLRTLGSSLFSQHDIYGGEWAGEPHDRLEDAAQEFVERKGVGTLRVTRDENGHPRALLNSELRVVNGFVDVYFTRDEAQAMVREARRMREAA